MGLANTLFWGARRLQDLNAIRRGPKATARRFLIRKPILRAVGGKVNKI